MANGVAISAALRSNLLSLQNTQSLMDTTQLALSTGRKINSALDGAQSFFAAQSLTNRASDLSRLLDAMGQSISTITEADTAVTALTSLLDQADALATQAREELSAASGQATAYGTADLSDVDDLLSLNGITASSSDTFSIATSSSIDEEIVIGSGDNAASLVAAINDTGDLEGAVNAKLNSAGQIEIASLTEGEYVRLTGSGGGGNDDLSAAGFEALGLGDLVYAEGDGSVSGTRVGGTIVAGNTLTSQAAASGTTASSLLSATAFATDLETGESASLTLTVDGVASGAITIDEDTTIQGVIDQINNDSALDGALTASFDEGTREISITTNGDVGNVLIETTATAAGTDGFAIDFGFAAGGSDATFANDDEVASEFITFSGGTADVTQLQTDYNEVRNQVDSLVEDASYRGINLLEGDNLTTAFNEDRSNTLTTEGVIFTASGLGITQADFSNVSSVDTSLSELRSAKTTVRNFGSSIANDLAMIQTREEFTQSTINTLESGSDKLTLADQNEESAKMLALQTRQQLGFVSLSLASQAQQGVLQLF